jgi:hypothetical protein
MELGSRATFSGTTSLKRDTPPMPDVT